MITALAVDPALAYDPELLGSATTATLVAIEGGRLEGELRASLRRLVDVGDHERRRIERDLHDSAQQRLVALRLRLDLAGETLARDPAEQEIVDELGREVDAAIQDIRERARGVYPPALAAHGPGAAIAAVIRRSGLRAVVRAGALPRLPEPIERTIYFCCLEALQNVAKHAGPGATATVRMHLDGCWVEFAIEDDGVGFPPGEVLPGAGLDNLADRVASHGGALRVGIRARCRGAGHGPDRDRGRRTCGGPAMTVVAGVDACKGGRVAIVIEDEQFADSLVAATLELHQSLLPGFAFAARTEPRLRERRTGDRSANPVSATTAHTTNHVTIVIRVALLSAISP